MIGCPRSRASRFTVRRASPVGRPLIRSRSAPEWGRKNNARPHARRVAPAAASAITARCFVRKTDKTGVTEVIDRGFVGAGDKSAVSVRAGMSALFKIRRDFCPSASPTRRCLPLTGCEFISRPPLVASQYRFLNRQDAKLARRGEFPIFFQPVAFMRNWPCPAFFEDRGACAAGGALAFSASWRLNLS